MIRTCGACPHLELHVNSVQGLGWASCGRAEVKGESVNSRAVPQHTEPRDAYTRWQSVFWRVPLWCPLPDSMVQRSVQRQPMHEWVEKSWSVPGERIQ